MGTSIIRKLTKSPNCNFVLWIGDEKLLLKEY
ncbi:MAG: hypothetical protein K2M78_11515 [Lachnospiraceae bacterium]|nr:hypothetical protein [Lachnospiraceae bacterium]